MEKPKIVYEHSTEEEKSGVIIDGMAEMMGADITGSEYEVGQEWPGVPNVPLPPVFYENKKRLIKPVTPDE